LQKTDNFEKKEKEFKKRLAKGEKILIISSYQTLGAGVNLQFPIPPLEKTIQINDRKNQKKMDIPGIYLDRPTNLLVNIVDNNITEENFIKYLFQLEFLQQAGAISPFEFENYLDKAFHTFIGKERPKKNLKLTHLYSTPIYTKFIIKVIIQALGRICRTSLKSPVIHILLDSSIKKHLKTFTFPDNFIPIIEFKTLKERAGEDGDLNDNYREKENKAALTSNNANTFITKFIKTPWDEDKISKWQDMREQVLKHPTIDFKKINESECEWSNLYIDLPEPSVEYRYKENYDYKFNEIYFSSNDGDKKVSEKSAFLDKLMNVKELNTYFDYKNYAKNFSKSHKIICPPVFNNIYKGALGEVCGKFILKKFLNIDLYELDKNIFEVFDYKTEDNIYIVLDRIQKKHKKSIY
jgi:hypothetical protein